MRHSIYQKLQQLRWTLLGVSVLVITLLEAYQYFQVDTKLEYLLTWLLYLIAAIVSIQLTFRQIILLHQRLDRQLESARRQTRYQQSLIQLSSLLATTFEEHQVCKIILDVLKQSLGYPVAAITLGKVGNQQKIIGDVEAVSRQEAPAVSLKRQLAERKPSPTRLVAPLRSGSETLGKLIVEKNDGSLFTPEEMTVIYAVADQSAIAIQNARWFWQQNQQKEEAEKRQEEYHTRERYLTALNQLTHDGLQSKGYYEMLNIMAEHLAAMFSADSCLLAQWDEEQKQLVPTASSSSLHPILHDGQILPSDVAVALTVLGNGRARTINSRNTSTFNTPRLLTRMQCRSLLALPLIADGQKLGVALVGFQVDREFSELEKSFGEQAASQIALALAKVRALSMAQHRAKELNALQRATAALLATIEVEELLSQILDAAMSAAPSADKGMLYLVAPETGQLQIRASHGYSDRRIRSFKPTSGESYPARAVRYRRPLLIDDAREDVSAQADNGNDNDQPVASMIVAPLLLGENALGAIVLASYRLRAFTQQDLNLLVSFATTATTALHNAQLHSEVQKQAVTDTLTGLYNRRGIFELGEREVLRAQRYDRVLSALLLDIDLFKHINDTHGHLVGDQILAGVAAQFQAELRQVDLLGRYGGDEFLALLSETNLEEATEIADRLRSKVAGLVFPAGQKLLKITISAGVAPMLEGDTLRALIERTDQALYRAKQAGRNCIKL